MKQLIFLGIWGLVSACTAGGRSPATPSPNGTPQAPSSVELSRVVVTPDEAASVDELFLRAEARLAAGDTPGGIALLDRVVAANPRDPAAARALLRSADALDAQGELEAAAARLERAARLQPGSDTARQALVRLVRLWCHLERWPQAGRAAAALLEHERALAPIELVVAHGGRGLSLVAVADIERAAYHVEKGRAVADAHGLDAPGKLPRDVAVLYFALGEIRRARAEQIKFVPVPERFGEVLEQRCQLLLDAQSAYSSAMRAYDAHWSTMAGYRVGELYQSLHADLLAVPPPATADTLARRQLFEGAMRLRYSILLEKALAMIDHTLALASRTGERSPWVQRASAIREQIKAAMGAEQAALARLPYTRADLEAALAALAQKAAAPLP